MGIRSRIKSIKDQLFKENKKMSVDPLLSASGSQSVFYNSTLAAGIANAAASNISGIMNSSAISNVSSIGTTNGYVISQSSYAPPTIISFYSPSSGSEIVRLNKDGTVTWSAGATVDEAAEMFSRTLTLGAEMQSGITQKVKTDMRDSVFEDIIAMAKIRGPLSADDLTFMLESSKIVEKLKS